MAVFFVAAGSAPALRAAAVGPQYTISPTSGSRGTTINFSGTGCPSAQYAEVLFEFAVKTGPTKPSDSFYGATVKAGPNGFQGTFQVPVVQTNLQADPGVHETWVQCEITAHDSRGTFHNPGPSTQGPVFTVTAFPIALPRTGTGGGAPAATTPRAASKSAVPIGLIAGGSAVVLIGIFGVARRPVLAFVTGSISSSRRTRRRHQHQNGHSACTARWATTLIATEEARVALARSLETTLSEVGGSLDEIAVSLERVAALFASLDGTPPAAEESPAEEVVVARRILRDAFAAAEGIK